MNYMAHTVRAERQALAGPHLGIPRVVLDRARCELPMTEWAIRAEVDRGPAIHQVPVTDVAALSERYPRHPKTWPRPQLEESGSCSAAYTDRSDSTTGSRQALTSRSSSLRSTSSGVLGGSGGWEPSRP